MTNTLYTAVITRIFDFDDYLPIRVVNFTNKKRAIEFIKDTYKNDKAELRQDGFLSIFDAIDKASKDEFNKDVVYYIHMFEEGYSSRHSFKYVVLETELIETEM